MKHRLFYMVWKGHEVSFDVDLIWVNRIIFFILGYFIGWILL